MNHQHVQRTLRLIGKVYGRILDSSHNVVLPSAIVNVKTSKILYDDRRRNQPRGIVPGTWGYIIDHSGPLRFIPSKIKDLDLQVDVYCDVQWKDDDIPFKQEIKVRIWSQHDMTIFDPERDSETIEEKLSDPKRKQLGRVVSRFHFDKANSEQKGPTYHLQFGGKPEDYELCWHPSSVNVPRLEYHPMELFLTCQMIAANFFWNEYEEIKQKSEWREALILWQEYLLLNHYQKCLDTIKEEKSLLDSLWMR